MTEEAKHTDRNEEEHQFKTVKDKERFHLNRSYYGLHLPPMYWREIDNFSSGSVCLVLASEVYNEKDYFRDYREYLRAMGGADE